jgi:hypothetical protein
MALGDLDVDGEIILQWILTKEGVTAYNTFKCFAVKEKKQSVLKSKSGFGGGDKEINPDPPGSRNSCRRHYATSCRFVMYRTFCPHSAFVCFVWIAEQTAIISLYSTNWLVCINETVCLLRGTDCSFIYTSD